jgi:hypothetical protein
VIAVGMLLVLVGFAMMASRSGVPGATAHRNVSLGFQRIFTTPGPDGVPSRRYRVIQVLAGLVVMAGGMVLIAVST